MAGKRQLLLRGEDAHAHAFGLLRPLRTALDKRVSDKLNSRAMACIRSVDNPTESITTASGLPSSAVPVKTSTMKYSSSGIA